MNKNIARIQGIWWFPDKPDNTISGILTINGLDSIELKTIGTLISWEILLTQNNDPQKTDIILGDALNGDCITLFGVIQTKTVGNSESIYDCRVAIVGRSHFLSKEEAVFTEAVANFSLLEEWLCKSGITQKQSRNTENGKLQLGFEYEKPDNLTYNVKKIDSRLSLSYSYNCKEQEKNCWLFKQISFLKLSPKNPQNLEWFLMNFEDIRRLLTVLIGFPTHLESVISFGDEIEFDIRTKAKSEFRVYTRKNSSFLESIKKYPSELLKTFPSLEKCFETLINNWFEKYEDLNPAIMLYVVCCH